MSGKHIIFNGKKINKSNFYKNKKLFKIDEILFSLKKRIVWYKKFI